MAKQTLEQAKLELEGLKKSVEILKASGMKDIPPAMSEAIEKLEKVIAGNASENFVQLFNSSIGEAINNGSEENQELVEALAAICGESGVKFMAKASKTAEGRTVIEFSTITVNRQIKTDGTGKTRAVKAGNTVYVVSINEGVELPEYAEKTGTFATAAAALKFILNGGKNPLNVGADYGKSDSAVRVLDKLAKMELFKTNFTCVTQEAPAATTPAPTTEAEPATAEEATEPATTEGQE